MANKTLSEQETILSKHQQLNDITQRIGFYRDEITVFEHRLEELVAKNTNKDILAQAEHFQNQFILQKERMDELDHEANLLKEVVDKLAKDPAWTALRLEKGGLVDQMNESEKILAETKTSFFHFLSGVY